MASPLMQLKDLVQDRLDHDLLPSIYAACSLRSLDIIVDFEGRGVRFSDWRLPKGTPGARPPLSELDESADLLIAQARVRAGVIGAAGGLGGAIGVAPEVMVSLVHTLRMCQRLAVIYGFDPETDRGRLVLWRALATAYDVELPAQTQLNLRVRDLPGAAAKQAPQAGAAAAMVLRRVINTATGRIIGRGIRLVPGLTAGLAAKRALEGSVRKGERMKSVFRSAWVAPPADLDDVVDVVEVA